MKRSDFTILVADDDPDYLFQTVSNLKRSGFRSVGIGIKAEDIENLFTEFVKIKSEKTRNITGSGLGLSILRKIIELYKGTIKVESTPEMGSSFTVHLPKKLINIAG